MASITVASYLVSPVGLAVVSVTYLIFSTLYSLFFHPLASYPGPRLAAISRIPYWWACISGTQVEWMVRLHGLHGRVVRYSPNDLSYVDERGEVWREINGHERGRPENPKATEFHQPSGNRCDNLVTANYDDHRRARRVFAPAFSDRAIKAQQPLLSHHADLLVRRIAELGREEGGGPVDMALLFNFTTFDIMGDLCLGQPLGLLEGTDAEYSPLIKAAFNSLRFIPLMQVIEYYRPLQLAWSLLEPARVRAMRVAHFRFSAERVDRRMARGVGGVDDKPDIWSMVLAAENKESGQLTVPEMHSNGELFLLAGAETTATLLAALMFFLLTNPDKYRAVRDEVRAAFSAQADINVTVLFGLGYLTACIQETLRIYPPLAVGVPRIVTSDGSGGASGGRVILGRHVAAGSRVSVHPYTTNHNPAGFREPERFLPERWLGAPEHAADDLRCIQPFSFGPRNCIGQRLTHTQARLIVAKLLVNFDWELTEQGAGWREGQRCHLLWEKRPLFCRMIPVGGERGGAGRSEPEHSRC